MILQEDINFLEHYGKKGMKWGVRKANNAKAAAKARKANSVRPGNRKNEDAQKRLDQVRRVASGKGSAADKLIVGAFKLPVQDLVLGGGLRGGAQVNLDRSANLKKKINAGKSRTTDRMLRLGGYDIRELNYSYTTR